MGSKLSLNKYLSSANPGRVHSIQVRLCRRNSTERSLERILTQFSPSATIAGVQSFPPLVAALSDSRSVNHDRLTSASNESRQNHPARVLSSVDLVIRLQGVCVTLCSKCNILCFDNIGFRNYPDSEHRI